jgi:hypothetical protein
MSVSVQRRVLREALVLGALMLTLGCVTAARDDAAEARARYAQCVAASGEPACRAERERALAAERTYQEQAMRAWGCDPAQADCPPAR